MTLKLDLRKEQILAESKKRTMDAQRALDVQVIKDSNYYCPEADGTLKRSALKSQPGSGVVKWDEKYAARQYYELPNKSKDANPNARMEWFEEAKATKKESWEKLANAEYHK